MIMTKLSASCFPLQLFNRTPVEAKVDLVPNILICVTV